MEILRGADARPAEPAPTVVTVGMFDGVHRGHAMLFQHVIRTASELAARSAVVTFDPHPLEVLAPDKAPCVLTPLDRRLQLFERVGLDVALVLRFDQKLASLNPAQFTRAALVEDLHVRKVIVGEDFRFGHGRAGDINTLRELGKTFGFEAEAIGLLGNGSAKISSTEIRRLVAEGSVEDAAQLLGRPYRLSGTVVPGQGVGRELHGLSTANLSPHPKACLPGLGVYAGWWVSDVERRPGVINVGKERGPQLATAAHVVVEIHIFDFDRDITGSSAEIEFTSFLRPEVRFAGNDQLAAQIRDDAARARKLLLG